VPVEPLTVKGRPTCSATLELPYPFSVEDQNLRGKEIIGFQPLILDADTKAADNSLQTARKHYGKTSLFTDDEGARILIDGIGLEFDTVSVDLNELAHSDPEWWTLGKMMTYRAQTEPFVHIDEDVFLWQRLPRELEQAPVFAQNAEYFSCAAWWYQPEALESVVKEHRGWLPDEGSGTGRPDKLRGASAAASSVAAGWTLYAIGLTSASA
jgi:Family of unknown function (DUF6734)